MNSRKAGSAAAHSFSRRAKHEEADTIGLERGQRVRGAKADRNVGRRPESLPHKRACPTEGVKQGPEANHRHKAAGVARKTARSTRTSGVASVAAWSAESGHDWVEERGSG
jgi:hypothetical protein